MDRYSLIWCSRYMDELLDKMGSDLFPMQVKLNRFQTVCLDFIRESTEYLEASQEISDDIRPLLIKEEVPLNGKMIDIPDNYLRLISIIPISDDGTIVAKKVSILKEGQYQAYRRDPFRTPTDEYPNIFRYSDGFYIDTGDRPKYVYKKAFISYIKKPTFATIDNVNERIVNLPDISIEQIMMKTCDSLRITTADANAGNTYGFTQTFGKKNR